MDATIFVLGIFIIIFFIILTSMSIKMQDEPQYRLQIYKYKNELNDEVEMTPQEFIKMRKNTLDRKCLYAYTLPQDFAGAYVLHNKTKNMFYVGQGKQVMNRVNNHFTGKGNGDVYADYKYGDVFGIRIIELEKSGFHTLNELERYLIHKYDAYYSGYNKTHGNKG